ncbi:MAG: aconitate hydratase AcnA [Armatimonadetes bacterium]|nr:aconitate hydratase AcnA [Armatimonadota bacterium]
MAHTPPDPFGAAATLKTETGPKRIFRLQALESVGDIRSLPYCLRVLLEACLRNLDAGAAAEEHVTALAGYDPSRSGLQEIPFTPGRVLLQDFTGVPALVDLAAMRSAVARMGADPGRVNPMVSCDLVIDHSVQVDAFNSPDALRLNAQFEFKRNKERYEFLKWGQSTFNGFRVVPPATGIVHQVNLEYLAKVVWEEEGTLYPDSLIGTDSHTTMINGLGVLGWGVGGIEAEAVMLGRPIYMLIPEVVGFKLTGELSEGATATDLVLTITQILREYGVVGKFVEFFGPGLEKMPVANRATIANMAPEYGATVGFFPVDDQTLKYLWLTGRPKELIDTVERYYKEQGLWRDEGQEIRYSAVLTLDLASVEPSLAGPKRPQDRVALRDMKRQWQTDIASVFGKVLPDVLGNDWAAEGGATGGTETERTTTVTAADPAAAGVPVALDGNEFELRHGDVVIAAITSCTNTSNPEVMIGAGLVARRARERGLTRKPWVKTSLAPGSKVVTDYLNKAGVTDDLEALGFYLVGYGCTTCIGNSGPLPDPISDAIKENDIVACSVLSGNRNFEGRINPHVKANYLASPPLVVAYAIAGTVNIDLTSEPLGTDANGVPVYLRDIWPTPQEVHDMIASCVDRDQFLKQYANVFEGSEEWRSIETRGGLLYDWPDESTYIKEPPFFKDLSPQPQPIQPIRGARCLVKVGDSVTTDHISPAGAIPADGPAGRYLIGEGVRPHMFNSFGSRRGNDKVMTRGTFANIRVRNQLAPGTEGGWTTDFTDGQVRTIFEAAQNYKSAGVPLVVLAGKDYGMGSSRDWAAKGTLLLGVRAVIAVSFERIHRSNLVGMGVLPLTFAPGDSAESLGLDGTETFDVAIDGGVKPRGEVRVTATKTDGSEVSFSTVCRLDTDVDVDYYRNGGILHMVLRRMAG